MSKELERVRDLLSRAGHPGTPEEEARTCAVIAARLIARLKFTIIDENNTEFYKTVNTGINWDDIDWVNSPEKYDTWQITLFRTVKAKRIELCEACGGHANIGDRIAKAIDGKGSTHYYCRDYWINGTKRKQKENEGK